jgi:Xaa-Pro aminopeptidase
VIESQRVGIESLRAGTRNAAAVDAMARAVIAEAGYGDHFTHRLGHGIGLDVHEPPFLDAGDERYVEAGMCFTVEPSIFMPGRLGSRVEDVVLVTPKGGEPLTKYDRGPRVVN